MDVIFRDPETKKGAKVDSEGRQVTFSIVESEDKYENRRGKQWSLYFTATPTGANDYFFYLKNLGSVDIGITDIRTMCAAPETVLNEWLEGDPTYTGAAADVEAVPKKGNSSFKPNAIIKSDVNITNVTSDGVLYFQRMDTANKRDKESISAAIIIPQGIGFGLKAVTGGNLITCVISIVELEEF